MNSYLGYQTADPLALSAVADNDDDDVIVDNVPLGGIRRGSVRAAAVPDCLL